MSSPAPHAVKQTFEDRIAWMRAPVHLTSDVLPRFVLIMLEWTLHSYLCSVAACLEYWIHRYRDGTLPGWPEDDDDEAADAPRVSKYCKKSHPPAPMCKAGAAHAPNAPGPVSGVPLEAPLGLLRVRPAGQNWEWVLVVSGAEASQLRDVWSPQERCRRNEIRGAAARGGIIASNSFRLFN